MPQLKCLLTPSLFFRFQGAVDLAFERLLKSGEWAYDFKWEPFAKPTGRFLQIMPSHSVVTISQVADPKKQPRDVVFRSNRRLNNQGWLTGLPNPKAQTDTSGLPHILLIHGHQELNFAHLAVPSEYHTQGYRHRSSNLMMMPYEVKSPEAPVEDTDIEAIITLKEEIDKWRRDNGQQ
jgi:hypothetical protein